MTEHEVEALTARLTRIWKPTDITPRSDEREIFWAEVEPGICLSVEDLHEVGIRFCLYVTEPGCGGSISYNELSDIECDIVKGPEQKYQQFIARWLPIFRRNCWLSGCDIEASAHEKAEWMQGFSHANVKGYRWSPINYSDDGSGQ